MVETSATPPRRIGRQRQIVFMLVLLSGLLALTELVFRTFGSVLSGRLGLDTTPTARVLSDQSAGIRTLLGNDRTLVVLDSVLGWRYRAGYDSGTHRLNRASQRSSREYTLAKPAGTLRLAAFGDSFVYGTEVDNSGVWSSLLEAAMPGAEVLNYGVGGYGTDQAFLLFLREGMLYDPDVVLIGFAPVNLQRVGNVYRRFLSTQEPPLVKPRFRLDPSGALIPLPPPLQKREDWERLLAAPARLTELGAEDDWYDGLRYESALYRHSATFRFGVALGYRIWRKYFWQGRLLSGGRFRVESGAFGIQRAILNAFADSVRARGAYPLVVIFPDKESVVNSAREPVYAPLRSALERDGRVEVLDLLDTFTAETKYTAVDDLFAPGLHYSRKGNDLVSRRLASRLAAIR